MFESLYIKDLALVTELELNFQKGFTVVTGETGAGKSLIFGAFRLLTGDRADKGMIRRGAKQSEVSAYFCLSDIEKTQRQEIEEFLTENGVELTDESLLIRRVITLTGNRCYLNGAAVPVATLKTLGEMLVDIHGPNEQQTLFKPSVQLQFLDEYLGQPLLLQTVKDNWSIIQKKHKELASLQEGVLTESELDYIRFQLAEIDKAALDVQEEEQISRRYKFLSSGRRLMELVSGIEQLLDNGNESAVSALEQMVVLFKELAELDAENGRDFLERSETLIDQLRDLERDVAHYGSRLDLDGEELQQLESRLEVIYRMKRRYGGTVERVLEQAAQWQEQVDSFDHLEERTLLLKREILNLEKQFQENAEKLSQERQTISQNLAKDITNQLRSLGFLQSEFKIQVTQTSPSAKGIDSVEFCFAPNPGEGIQPLRKIGSSGELARVMLAIKTVLGNIDHIPVLIFDEVDANVGGHVAFDVAREMKKLGNWHQTFAITHLVQIAAAGDAHYLVKKDVEDERTSTHIILLDEEGRQQELMRMMGADKHSVGAQEHVKEIREMLEQVTK